MRSGVALKDEQPSPEPDLDAKADAALDGHLELVQRIQARLAAGIDADQLLIEIINLGIHLEELRGELAAHAAAKDAFKGAFAAGRAFERSQADARREVPERSRRVAPERPLKLVQGASV